MEILEDDNNCCNPHSIVAEFYDKILGYVIKRVNDIEVAKDITQEVVGRLIEAYDKKIEIENIKAWLFRVAKNLIIDRYRKDDYLNFVDTNLDSENSDNDVSLSAEDFIISMIDILPNDYKVPLYMSDIENKKHAEIAKELNLSVSAVKMRCQRARKKLHELFLECCDIQYTENGSFASCTIKASCDILLREEEKLNKKKE